VSTVAVAVVNLVVAVAIGSLNIAAAESVSLTSLSLLVFCIREKPS
jgi:hypothetical protein